MFFKLTRLALVIAALAVPAMPAHAVDVDWFGGLRLSDGDRTVLSLSAVHFGSDQAESNHLARQLVDPREDLPVLLFLAAESGRTTSFILDLRMGGLSWWEIRARLGIAPKRVVVALPRDPGPPYGKAWGHYRKHPGHKNAPRSVALTDTEFSDWIGARVVSRAYGIDVVAVLESRSEGLSLAEVVTLQEQRQDTGKPSGKNKSHSASAGKSKGKGHGANR
jgi:hypothetical protein